MQHPLTVGTPIVWNNSIKKKSLYHPKFFRKSCIENYFQVQQKSAKPDSKVNVKNEKDNEKNDKENLMRERNRERERWTVRDRDILREKNLSQKVGR